jgi:hypothetical protein
MDEPRQLWVCAGLAGGSPFAAVGLSLAAFTLMSLLGFDGEGYVTTIGVANGALAVAGSAAGVMLAPRAGVATRVMLACAFAVMAALIYWVTLAAATLLAYGFAP